MWSHPRGLLTKRWHPGLRLAQLAPGYLSGVCDWRNRCSTENRGFFSRCSRRQSRAASCSGVPIWHGPGGRFDTLGGLPVSAVSFNSVVRAVVSDDGFDGSPFIACSLGSVRDFSQCQKLGYPLLADHMLSMKARSRALRSGLSGSMLAGLATEPMRWCTCSFCTV
jgi:hypothetical protein